MAETVREYLIYIHGVSQDNNQDHQEAYNDLHEGIKQQFADPSPWERAKRCYVEWGWNYDRQAAPEKDRLLAEAQDQFAERVLPEIEQASDWGVNPARLLLFTLRELMLKGFSDMFYYTSRDGKSSVRATVASQILQCVEPSLKKEEPISLTFLGHSAGSVVAFDFLFYLFLAEQDFKEHQFIEDQYSDSMSADKVEEFRKLRSLAHSERFRIRRLVTFGSPISMLAFRSNPVVEILARGDKLNPSNYGFDRNPSVFGTLSGPRWLNFWDKDDIIAWPVEPLMHSAAVEDIYSDAGDRVATVHNNYWRSKEVHQKIAALW